MRDSGKTPLDAVLGEIVVTVEKLQWLIADGEAALKPQHRKAGVMVSVAHAGSCKTGISGCASF